MAWILLDVAVAVVALTVFAAVALRLYRHGRTLGGSVGLAGDRVADAMSTIEALQDAQRTGTYAGRQHPIEEKP